jgi:toxin secretion/phage lysis holin
MEKAKWLVSVLLGLILSFTQKYGIMIIFVAVAIVFDFATGLIKANIKGEVSSEVGKKGFFKKMALLICLFFGFFLDFVIPYMCATIGIKIPFETPFGLIICFYIVLNESISICENLYACNPGIMPKWVVRMLKSAKQQIDDKGGAESEKPSEE